MTIDVTILGILMYFPCVQATTWYDGLPSGTYTNRTDSEQMQYLRNQGTQFMHYSGVQDGDATQVCTNWVCPTSIVVGTISYNVVTNWWRGRLEFAITTTNQPASTVAKGRIIIEESEQMARLSLFTELSCTSLDLPVCAQGVLVQPLDPATNMMFVTDVSYDPKMCQRLVYKNIYIQYDVMRDALSGPATNALAFTAALINEGLPEDDRIPLPTTQ